MTQEGATDPDFVKDMANEANQLAIQAQLLGQGCAKNLKCCDPDDPELHEWVEHRTYGGYWPRPRLPLPSCERGDRKAKCDMCKAAVKIEAKDKETFCKAYFIEHNTPTNAPRASLAPVFARSMVAMPAQVPKHKSFKFKVRLADYVFNLYHPTICWSDT